MLRFFFPGKQLIEMLVMVSLYLGRPYNTAVVPCGVVCKAWMVNLLKHDRQTRTGLDDWCCRTQRLLEHALQQTIPHLRQWCYKHGTSSSSSNGSHSTSVVVWLQ